MLFLEEEEADEGKEDAENDAEERGVHPVQDDNADHADADVEAPEPNFLPEPGKNRRANAVAEKLLVEVGAADVER